MLGGGVLRLVHHDRAVERVGIGRVETVEPDRHAEPPHIPAARGVGAAAGGMRAVEIGIALEPAIVLGVRAIAMADVEAFDPLAVQIDKMEPTVSGMQTEVRDPDDIAPPDPVSHPRQFTAGQLDQLAIAQRGPSELSGGAQRQRGDGTGHEPGLDKITAFHRLSLYHLSS